MEFLTFSKSVYEEMLEMKWLIPFTALLVCSMGTKSADAGLFDFLHDDGCCKPKCCEPAPETCCQPKPCCQPKLCCSSCDPCRKKCFFSRLFHRRHFHLSDWLRLDRHRCGCHKHHCGHRHSCGGCNSCGHPTTNIQEPIPGTVTY